MILVASHISWGLAEQAVVAALTAWGGAAWTRLRALFTPKPRAEVAEKKGLPILTYHHHLPLELKETSCFREGSVTNTVESFAEQMAWLREHDYATMKLAELEDYLRGEEMDISRKLMITFDDGHLSVSRYCYDILKQYGYTAVVFMITGKQPEQPVEVLEPDLLQYVSRQEMLDQADVFEWAAHTYRMHARDEHRVSRLISSSQAALMADAAMCRAALNGTEHFCFPFGQYDRRVIDTLVEVGYRYFYSTERGLVYPDPDHDVHVLRRLNVSPRMTVAQFGRLMGTRR